MCCRSNFFRIFFLPLARSMAIFLAKVDLKIPGIQYTRILSPLSSFKMPGSVAPWNNQTTNCLHIYLFNPLITSVLSLCPCKITLFASWFYELLAVSYRQNWIGKGGGDLVNDLEWWGRDRSLIFFQVSVNEVRIIPISRQSGTLQKFRKYSTRLAFLIDLMIVRVHW